jgi:hypothetical protein
MCSAVCQSVVLRNGQARRTPLLMLQYICSVRPCAYMLATWSMPTRQHVETCRRSAVWQWLLASCVAIMRRCCLRLKSTGAEASSWHVTRHTLQLSQAYMHAPVTCAELSACTTTAVRASPLYLACSHLRVGCAMFTPHRRHQHGSRATPMAASSA